VSSIVMLERTPHDVPPQRFLAILKELRDDLRIIIVSATSQQTGETSLAAQIAPMRHRLTRLFEAQGVECRWHASGIDTCELPSGKCLDLMRVLQEALTNVFKHSSASLVEVTMLCDGSSPAARGPQQRHRLSAASRRAAGNGDAQHAGASQPAWRHMRCQVGTRLHVDHTAYPALCGPCLNTDSCQV
jgi:hypothetical protein